MKTQWTVIAVIMVFVGIALIPVGQAQAAVTDRDAIQNAPDNPVQLQCDGAPRGRQTGPRDGSRGQNAPRDGRGARRGDGPRDGSGNGPRHGRQTGPRDGSGPGCN